MSAWSSPLAICIVEFIGSVSLDSQCVDFPRHEIAHGLIDHAMSRNLVFSFELLRHEKHLKVPAAAFTRTGMSGVFMAVIEYLDGLRTEGGQSLPNQFNRIHQGRTLVKGLTLTLANTPPVT